MQKEEQRFADSDILEGMTSISALLSATQANDRKIEKIWIDRTKRRSKAAEIGFLTAKSHERGFSIEFTSAEEIAKCAIGNTHGGILAFCSEREIPRLTENVDRIQKNGVYILLDGIEDPYNFGYAIRSLYASGADGVLLSPRNWMSVAGIVAKSSAGTSELMDMFLADHEEAVGVMKSLGYRIVAAGIRDSVSMYEGNFTKPILLIVGGEKRGISASLCAKADEIIRIEYGRSFRGSLSAASAATILAYEIYRQNR